MPAADDFPLPSAPEPDPLHPLSMWLCRACGLAQLSLDDTDTAEPLAVEPQAVRDQAADAVARVHDWPGLAQSRPRSHPESHPESRTVIEFGSPHGGSWLGLFAERGWVGRSADDDAPGPADVVVDTFGLMHEPDVAEALRLRVARLAEDGVLLVLFHSLEAIVGRRQWSSLRHGHFAYFSITSLRAVLADAGLVVQHAWEFDLYGGTVLIAAERTNLAAGQDEGGPDPSVRTVLDRERDLGLGDPDRVRVLQDAADTETSALQLALAAIDPDRPWYAYGAASRAVAVLHRAGARTDRLRAVADASPGKQGRAMPGSRIPVISPAELVADDPQHVWLLLPDLLEEVSAAYPALAGRWASPGSAP